MASRPADPPALRVVLVALVALLGLLLAAPAALGDGVEEWSLSAGVFDVGKSRETGQAGVEARFRTFHLGFGAFELPVEPAVGVFVNGDEAAYVGSTLRVPLAEIWPDGWPRGWRVVPYTGVGLYDDGESKDLGGPVEFRSGVEVSWRAGERWWIGVDFYHLSNAVIYDRNPGAESLVLTVSWR